jgi:FdhE protein
MPTATVRVLPAEEIASRAGGKTVPYRWPQRSLYFADRAMRLRHLASGHTMGDFLLFMSQLALAQQAALSALAAPGRSGGITIPDAAAIDRASMAGEPPLATAGGARDRAWFAVLADIVAAMRKQVHTGPAADTLARLAEADEVFLERQADALLTGVMAGLDLAAAPIVAAALQVVWVHQVIELVAAHAQHAGAATQPIGLLDDAGSCPCCGSRPVASITRSDSDTAGQRYLHCSLCGTEWQVPRGRCTHCGEASAEKVAYQSLDRADAPGRADSSAASATPAAKTDAEADEDSRVAQATIQAETCDTCGHYLKIVHGDRDPFAEPVADDLASITLDLLVAETGKQRHGVNLMLLFGDPGDADDPGDPGDASAAPPGAG